MRDLHQLRIVAKSGAGTDAEIWLDGNQLYCSRIELTLDAKEATSATITLPMIGLELDMAEVGAEVDTVSIPVEPYTSER